MIKYSNTTGSEIKLPNVHITTLVDNIPQKWYKHTNDSWSYKEDNPLKYLPCFPQLGIIEKRACAYLTHNFYTALNDLQLSSFYVTCL